MKKLINNLVEYFNKPITCNCDELYHLRQQTMLKMCNYMNKVQDEYVEVLNDLLERVNELENKVEKLEKNK